ncbi:MAG: hypothetical protein ABS81_07230 [Pseudonocardia sp. SCN 72-86]|nr:MAG: hypothetical protein ABS81_07230 [Pseudonocardia sp. SCN 72-86]
MRDFPTALVGFVVFVFLLVFGLGALQGIANADAAVSEPVAHGCWTYGEPGVPWTCGPMTDAPADPAATVLIQVPVEYLTDAQYERVADTALSSPFDGCECLYLSENTLREIGATL